MIDARTYAIAVAAGMGFFLGKSRWNYTRLPELPPVGTAGVDDLTVVIPARNEESSIARAVSCFQGSRVIVVDDASNDRTAAVASAAGAEAVPAPSLPTGAAGKPNACAAGATLAGTKWVLFVDADTWYSPEFAAAAVAHAEREGLDLLTCFLRNVQESAWERVLLPYSFALYFAGVSARAVNSGASRQALANGQCMLFRRSAYEAVGGHGAVRTSIVEDVALAQLMKLAGFKVRVMRAERLGSVRMYDSLGAIWRGFAKNTFRFLQANPATGAQVIAASVLLASYLPALGALLWNGDLLLAAAFALLPSVLLWPWYRGVDAGLGAPVAIHVFQAIALDGMARTLLRLGTDWKGRRVG